LAGSSQRVELSADKAPKWQLLMPVGSFHRNDFPTKSGRIDVDAKYVAAMVANWERIGKPKLPIDYHHRGSSSDTSIRNEDKIAAGWVKEIRATDAGLEGLVSWTDRARERIQAEELAYFSPEWFHDGVDKTTGKSQGPTFCGGGLLNDPFFLGELQPMAAAAEPSPQPTESHVNKKLLCARLGLAEDATDEQINAALAASESLKAAAADESLKASVETLKGELAAAVKSAAESAKELQSIKAATAKRELESLQESLIKAGKLKAADKPRVEKLVAALGIDDATKMTADWPVVVELGERGTGAGGAGDETAETANAKFESLVAEEMKKGATSREAMRRVTAANRDLAIKATTVSSQKPAEA
jgi:phage I-like protein